MTWSYLGYFYSFKKNTFISIASNEKNKHKVYLFKQEKFVKFERVSKYYLSSS